jgi:hypothetical protein
LDRVNILSLIDDIKSSFSKVESPKARFRFRDMTFFLQFVRPVWKLGALSLILAVLQLLTKSSEDKSKKAAPK